MNKIAVVAIANRLKPCTSGWSSEYAMKETSKAMRRRWCEHEQGVFPWRDLFRGAMLDVGAGDDPLPFQTCRPFDTTDGDANQLSTYFAPESFDLINASQVVEHLNYPLACLIDWLTLLRPGGHLVVTVPDFDLYEKRCFPSRYNGDHKAVFSLWRRGFPGLNGKLYNVPLMLNGIESIDVKLCRLVTTNFDWNAPEDIDQTFQEEKQIECWIEFVLKK